MSVAFSGSSGCLHQLNWQSRYNWNIVESGVKHHQTNKQTNRRDKIPESNIEPIDDTHGLGYMFGNLNTWCGYQNTKPRQ